MGKSGSALTNQTHNATLVYAVNSIPIWRILPIGRASFEVPRA